MMMKRATLWNLAMVAGFLLYFAPANAQRNLALYGMPGLHQATHVNPSFLPDASLVIGLPIIGNVQAGFKSTGFTLEDVGASSWDIRGMSLDYPTVLPLVRENNLAFTGVSTNLFAVGFRLKNDYIALEASEHLFGNAYYPKAAILFGSDLKEGVFKPGQAYNLDGFDFDLTHYRNFSLAYARNFGRASAGVRIHYLVGLENYSTSGPGVVLTATEAMDVYKVDGQLQLWSAGASSLSGEGSYPISGQGNYGFAFDFGSTYAIGEKLTASFSVINLGGINWTKGVHRKVISNEIEDPKQKIEDIFDGFIHGKPSSQLTYNTALPTFVYIGSAYQIDDKSTFNLLFNSRYVQSRHNLGAAISYTRKLSNAIRASLAYSATNEALANLGASMTIKVGPLQLWGAADNLLSIVNPAIFSNAHINVGVNLAFYKKPQAPIAMLDTMDISGPEEQLAMVTPPPAKQEA
ncbi:MAG: hypothetical protein KDD06_24150, partial [Phaeodactylibacter sp.]|nr:hypothetical protein [Phaeodactylibacter sp.]